MSRIKVDTAVNKTATGPVDFPSGITGVAATFTGNVTVGGTITYDDVQNVDSVGVVTAGKGLRVTAEGIVVTAGIATLSGGANLGGANITFGDSGTVNDDRLIFGASSDLSIYHDGSNSYINESGTGDLYIRGGTSVRITDLSDNKMFLGQDGGEAQLYYDGLEKLATKTGGVTITGNAVATSKFRGNDDVKVSLGDGEDLQLYHDGTHSYINEGGTGSLKILSSAVAINKADDSEAVARFYEDGACELYYDDSKKIETTTSGVTVTGELTATSYVGNGSGLSGVGGENDITSCLFT